MAGIKKWADSEIKILLDNYENSTNDKLCLLLPLKTINQIYKKANTLGLRKSNEAMFINRSVALRKLPHKDVVFTNKGYKKVYMPHHPRADVKGRVLEHVVVWEKAHNMPIPEGHCVHHINGNKHDNVPENLLLLNIGEHIKLHNSQRTMSNEAKDKIRAKAIIRLSDERNHPNYKNVNIDEMYNEVLNGETVKSVCKKHAISKTAYYSKLKRRNII